MSPIPSSLILPDRLGRKLPADIAYLLAKYPREVWPTHVNFAGMAEAWIERHDYFRELGAMLMHSTHEFRERPVNPAEFRRFFAQRLNLFLGHLEGHHNIEDYEYFPRFRAIDKRLIVGFDLLENDHAVIHDLLEQSGEAGQGFYQATLADCDAQRFAADAYVAVQDKLVAWLLRHLEDEEDLLVPTLLEHTESALFRR